MNRHVQIASASLESCLCKQNQVIEKFHAKPKVFGYKFYAGLRAKVVLQVKCCGCIITHFCRSFMNLGQSSLLTTIVVNENDEFKFDVTLKILINNLMTNINLIGKLNI